MAAEQGLVATSSSQGFTTKGLRGRTAQLWMVPELGGRVVSLRSLRTGREWCWRRPGPHWLWANDAGDDFGSSPQAGIDECVPTVAACQVRGRRLPDHGEVWYQDWRLDPAAEAAGVLRAELNLTVSTRPATSSSTTACATPGTSRSPGCGACIPCWPWSPATGSTCPRKFAA